MKKYYLFYYLLLIFSFLFIFFIYYYFHQFSKVEPAGASEVNPSSNKELYSAKDFISDIYDSLVPRLKNINSFSEISKQYCLAVFENLKDKRLIYNFGSLSKNGSLVLDPECSIWLNIFCKKYIGGYINSQLPINQNLNFLKTLTDELSRSRAIFNVLMNDYFNSKVLSIYVNFFGNGSINDAIKDFSNKYFGYGGQICGDSSLYYLYPKNKKPQSLSDKQAICSHPMTYNYVRSNVESMIMLKSHLKLINYNLLVDTSECGFSDAFKVVTSTYSTDMIKFYNILMNEYFWYSLYLNLYKFILLQKKGSITYSGKVYVNASLSYLNSINDSTIEDINEDLTKSYRAILLSIRVLSNLEWAWPIHVALLAYFEDILKFRKYLVKLYTPLDQLYYKLRNVQDLEN